MAEPWFRYARAGGAWSVAPVGWRGWSALVTLPLAPWLAALAWSTTHPFVRHSWRAWLLSSAGEAVALLALAGLIRSRGVREP